MSQQVEPVIVSGSQGGGKTTYLREMHARYDGESVFLTVKSNERTAHDRPPERICQSSAVYPDDIRDVREWALNRSEEVQVIIDECQNAPTFTTGDGPIKTMLHEDREAGVKTVIATQSPSDLRTKENGYAPVQQCDWWVWCGPLMSFHAGFFNANGLSDVKRLMPSKKYKFAVMKPIESLSPEEKIECENETLPEFG
jgi:hypothetical protein